MYMARFTGFTTLNYGTYVDQDEDVVLNDMIILGDGRIAFSGAADCGADEDCTDNELHNPGQRLRRQRRCGVALTRSRVSSAPSGWPERSLSSAASAARARTSSTACST